MKKPISFLHLLSRTVRSPLRFLYRRLHTATAASLVRHAKRCRDMETAYVWGGLGEIITLQDLEQKRSMYPDHYPEEVWQRLTGLCGRGVRGFDCTGLIKNYLMGGIHGFRYDPEQDRNSEMLLKTAACKGAMDTMPEEPGICLYMEGHVGIYIGNGDVIEATANPRFGNGVVQTRLSDRQWSAWFSCPNIRYRRLSC